MKHPFSSSKTVITSICLVVASFYSGNLWSTNIYKPTSSPKTTPTTLTVNRSTTPELKFFVMSYCPYGNQIEDTLRPVFDLIGNQATIQPHYIFDKIDNLDSYCQSRNGDPNSCDQYITAGYFKTINECRQTINTSLSQCKDTKNYIKTDSNIYYGALHGRSEAVQNVREICAWNLASEKKQWWDFVGNINQNCTVQNSDTCWEDQAKKAGYDTSKIVECFNKEGISLIEKEIAVTAQYNAQSSPTIYINDVLFPPESAYTNDGQGSLKIGKSVVTQDKYRTPNVLKTILCESMTKQPKECKTILPDPPATTTGGCGI